MSLHRTPHVPGTCNESVATRGLRMHYHRCARKALEPNGDRCKVHSESSVKRREIEAFNRYRTRERARLKGSAYWFVESYADLAELNDLEARIRVRREELRRGELSSG